MVSKAVVTGGNGFIGGHLVKKLKDKGYWVRSVDIKRKEFGKQYADEFMFADMRNLYEAYKATKGMDDVFALAADMGGMGFISKNHFLILQNNLRINLNTVQASVENKVKRYLYTSSACVYPEELQTSENVVPLKESDAYPANPQDAYGWEKLVSERVVNHAREEHGLDTRIVRFHNIYGPEGTYDGGREKAPAALCRKVALADEGGSIDVWGDGEQTRSFCYIDDCTSGIMRLLASGYQQPLNLGRNELTSINNLASIIIDISGKRLGINHIEGPEGVRGRNSDNTLCEQILNWSPGIDLKEGLTTTYQWVEQMVNKQ